MNFSADDISEWKGILCDELQNKTDDEINDYLFNLQELTLYQLKCESLPKSLGKLRNLIYLRVWSCPNITTLPEQIGQLANLSELRVLYCERLTHLPNSVCQLLNLKKLQLSDCHQFGELPEQMGQLQQLEVLERHSCLYMQSIPKQIWQLKNLTELTLTAVNAVLPDDIGQLRKLQKLNLSGSQFKNLPDNIGKLENLCLLVLSYSNLKALPDTIGQLKNLKYLHLNGCNQLTGLPESIGQLGNSLQTLELDGCDFMALPNSIGQLKRLPNKWRLPMGLTSLPEQIRELSFIRHLIITIDDKHLDIIEHIVRLLPNITTLEIRDAGYHSNCSLTRLPETIGQLWALQILDLSGCEYLKILPEQSIGQLRNLKILDLHYCPKLKVSNEFFDALSECQILGKKRKKQS
ncbi:MAG: hypothetical protein IJ187_07475 [Neisseriaceae bacterium]|nr:hypothetical protein [Neisseriaceae bacterium]